MTHSLKRVVMILGGKGGTGKTLFCRSLYYALITAKVNVLGFDTDIENPEFEEYHAQSTHPVTLLNFLETSEAKEFFTKLDIHKPEAVLVDMPGASGRATREQMDQFGIFDIAKELGYRLTISTVLSNSYTPISSFQTMLEFCGDRADYVAVKSQLWNQGSLTFERWETSEVRQTFLDLRGIEIDMPILEASVFDTLHEKALSFLNYADVAFGDRLLIDSFLRRNQIELNQAAKYLGLPSAKASTKSTSKSTKSTVVEPPNPTTPEP
jgi:hypothetical protein